MGAVDYINPEQVSDEIGPSRRQVYKLAAVALEALGREWPHSKREATELINELQLEPLMRVLEDAPGAWVQAS
jgi:hypothetical protein